MKPEEMNALNLAFLGDAVYSVMVREYLVSLKDDPVAVLTNKTKKYVAATAQAKVMHKLLEEFPLTEEEISVYHRGRNSHKNSGAKNADPVTYHVATGFESLIGYLYVKNERERLGQIWDWIRTNSEE